MRSVFPNVWIGNADDGRNLVEIHRAEIKAVVDLAFEEAPATLSRELIYVRIPIVDGSDNLPGCIRIASRLLFNSLNPRFQHW